MKWALRSRRIAGLIWGSFYTLELLSLVYLLSFPIACLLDNTRVPVVLRPLGHLLETPASGVMEWYLRLWKVDPNLVRCALYEP